MENTAIIGKIKKLLALSTSPEVHEAAAALEKATQLMKEYNITHDTIKISEIKEKQGNTSRGKEGPITDEQILVFQNYLANFNFTSL